MIIRPAFAASALVSVAALAAGGAQAQSLAVEPGLWEFKSESGATFTQGDKSMSSPLQTETKTMCVSKDDATLTPEKLSRTGCTTTKPSLTERSLMFVMTCSQSGVDITGVLTFNLSDDRKSGHSFVSLSGAAGGGGFLAIIDADAKRIGDC